MFKEFFKITLRIQEVLMAQEELKQMANSATRATIAALLVLIYICFPTSVLATYYYVDSWSSAKNCGGAGGLSWSDPAPDITCGISKASSGDTVWVRNRGAGRGNAYAGFNMVDGIRVQAEDCTGLGPPVVEGTIQFPSGITTAGSVLDCVEILDQSPSMRMLGTSGNSISNNAIVQNCLFNGGVKPAIKHQGGSPIIQNNEFTGKDRTAIRIYQSAGSSSEAMIIRGNDFHGNGLGGGGSVMYTEIHLEKDATAGRYVLFQDNLIHDNSFAGGFGIDESSDDTIYLTGNEIYINPWAGFRLGTKDDGSGTTHTGQITISGEPSFSFAGTPYTNGAPNKIHDNGRGGITTGVGCTMDIIRNEIYNNGWGGHSYRIRRTA